jgi:hypothetical protein
MSEYVIMPSADYQAACDVIRTASGKTDLIKSGDLSSEISELANKIGKVSFKTSTMPCSAKWSSVTYGNGKFVAVANDTNMYVGYSTDGVNWSISAIEFNFCTYIAYYNNKFIIVSSGGTYMQYSTDGINWSECNLPQHNLTIASIAYGDGKFVAVLQTNATMHSTDGINWSKNVLNTTGIHFDAVTYGNGKFVAVKSAIGSGKCRIMSSTDGIDWSYIETPYYIHNLVTYGNGKFVIAVRQGFGYDFRGLYSTDGINWSNITIPFLLGNISLIAYADGKFVIMESNSNIAACCDFYSVGIV